MEIKCPCCGTPVKVNVKISAKITYTEDECDIFNSLNQWLRGGNPYKDTFIKIEDFKYKFSVQLEDSPDGDTWAHGIVKWIPGCGPEILEKTYSPIRGF